MGRAAGDGGEGGGEVGVGDVGDREAEVETVGLGRVAEDPAGVVFAVIEGGVGDGAGAEGDAPRHDAVFDGGRHDGAGCDGHFDIGACGEEGGDHAAVVEFAALGFGVVVLEEDPFADAALAVVVPSMQGGVPARALVDVVQIPIDVVCNAGFEGELVGTNGPEDLRLFARVEPINVDEGAVAACKAGAEIFLAGEGAFEELNMVGVEGLEFLGALRRRIACEDTHGEEVVFNKAADDGDALGAGAADDEDFPRH